MSIGQARVIAGEGLSTDTGESSETADEVLIADVQRGDRDALALLFRRYARPVRNIGQRILRDKAEADDLIQEVFLYIHRKSAVFDSTKGTARSWILQVAYTQALLRRRRLKSNGFYSSVITDNVAEDSHHSAQGAHYDNTVEGFFGRNGWKKVWDSLTECQRETLRLHFYEGCTFTEIAERLGQSYVNIRHNYYRGLEKLRKHAEDNNLNWP
ncbi:MAG: sigma-70 family RNA polymerase sigma factor [Candidatus Acidiferrales bacterium]